MPFDWTPPPDENEPSTTGQTRRGRSETSCSGWDNGGCVGTPYCPPRCPRFFDRSGAARLVRLYREDDFPALVEMYGGIDSKSFGLPPKTTAGIESWLADLTDRGWNLVAFAADRPVGHLGVVPADASEPEFIVFVHDDYQRRGIGTELVKQAIAYAAADEYDALTLMVHKGNTTAITVYTNVGFEVVTRDLGELEMRLPLDRPIADAVRRPPAYRT